VIAASSTGWPRWAAVAIGLTLLGCQEPAPLALARPASRLARPALPPPDVTSQAQDSLPLAAVVTPVEPDPEAEPFAAAESIVGQFGAGMASGRGHSVGTAQNGWLDGGLPLLDGPALRVLGHTRQRNFVWGTTELASLLQRSAAAVASEFPGSVLHVGNLSRLGGGDIPPSVSHNSGRDADVIFFAFDRLGGSREATGFTHYDAEGIADSPPAETGRLEFDTARNWTLVRHLLSDPRVVVQWIFVSVPLRNRLLDYALRQGEPWSLRQRATHVLVQPRDSSPHADHFHVRIACPAADRPACIDGFGTTAGARTAQVDALLEMYDHGSPAEQRYARELLSLPTDGEDADLPPIEGGD
jgi:penicillin-insensitive murein endopeptidase